MAPPQLFCVIPTPKPYLDRTRSEQHTWATKAFQILRHADRNRPLPEPSSVAPVAVPDAKSTSDENLTFARTFDAYQRLGGHDVPAGIGNHVLGMWLDRREIPDDVIVLRVALSFEHRRWQHRGLPPDARSEEYLHIIVAHLHRLTGGFVDGPPDAPTDPPSM